MLLPTCLPSHIPRLPQKLEGCSGQAGGEWQGDMVRKGQGGQPAPSGEAEGHGSNFSTKKGERK